MDSNPGVSLFQGADIQIDNAKNVEEEEDLEDQIRRKEELQNLLQAKLDDFYDDSTINSSTNVSLVSNGNLEQLYKDAITPDEQLKVLYEVRCRELQNLKNDYDKFKQQKQSELSGQINQKLLLENELQQIKISLKNSENLLVDKTKFINELTKTLEEKEQEIKKLKDNVYSCERDLEVYKSENAELHLKVQSQTFNLDAKYGAEELKKSLQHKIDKLENELEIQCRKTAVCSKENQALQDEIERLISEKNSLENDNGVLETNFDAAQKQCRDLIEVIQALKQENSYYKDRVNEILLTRDSQLKDNSNSSRTESLRKMLVDKSVELESVKVKLKSYESALKECTEYRQLKTEMLKKEFKQCNNQSHTKDLLVLQNELRNYQRQLDEKTRQITELQQNNKDLKEKIEDMLIQTRTEIQNISSKYNMPQLEAMKQELENLTRDLEESEQERFSLIQKLENQANELEKCREELASVNALLSGERQQNVKLSSELNRQKDQFVKLKQQSKSLPDSDNAKTDYESLKLQLRNVMEHLEKKNDVRHGSHLIPKIAAQMNNFLDEIHGRSIEKGLLEEKIDSWIKMLRDVEIEAQPDEALKSQHQEALVRLHEFEEKNKQLEEIIQELKNAVTIAEGEKCELSVQLENAKKKQIELEKLIEELKLACTSREDEYKIKMQTDSDALKREIKVKEDNLVECQQRIKRLEEEKQEAKKWLENVKKEMDKLRNENNRLVKETNIPVEEELVKSELKLRDELQIEYQSRINEIERRYEKAFKETTEVCKQQKAELEAQDKKLREYLKVILTECESCTTRLEHEKLELNSQIQLVRDDLDKCKSRAETRETIYQIALKKLEKEGRKSSEEWKEYSKKVVCSCLDIEATNKKVRDRVLASMDKYDNEIESIRSMFDSKSARKIKKSKTSEV